MNEINGDTFIAADINFNSKKIAKELNITVESYNNKIINNWNEIVKQNDTVLCLGKISDSYGKDLKEIVKALNGHKYICSHNQNNYLKPERWKQIGFEGICSANLIFELEKSKTILFPSFVEYSKWDYTYYGLSEIHKMGGIFKDNCLNISIKNWGYSPINLKDIENIIKRMKEFEELKED